MRYCSYLERPLAVFISQYSNQEQNDFDLEQKHYLINTKKSKCNLHHSVACLYA